MTRFAHAGVVLLWAALLLGMLGRYAWPLDLFAHFRLHYAVLFGACAAVLAVRRRIAFSVAALVGLLVSASPIAAYVRAAPAGAHASTPALRLVSFNIWFRNQDAERIAEFLNGAAADVIVLQEAFGPIVQQLRARLPEHPHVHIDPDRHGAVIFSRLPLSNSQLIALAPGGSSAAYSEIAWQGARIRLFGVHLHWPLAQRAARLRNQELETLVQLAAHAEGPLIILGDFNATPWSPVFQDALTRSGLKDCARGRGVSASWPSHAPWLGLRIDHCWASKHIGVHALTLGPHLGSDHRALIVDVTLAP